ncbi:ABC-type transport system substrate-binding protein [Bradyrhizobium sp. i1.3.6]
MRFVSFRPAASVLATTALLLIATAPSQAQTRAETLRYVTGSAVNTLDPNIPGSTRESFALSMSTYDRLVAFGRKQLNGKWVFDLDTITGELAESYDVSSDGLKLTFRLRKDAKFQDGSPVTADDVKWSLDRCVTAPILGKAQLLTGSLTSADQFKVIDPLTIEVTLPKPDKLALPNLATVYPLIINSKVAKEHATPDDPWATAWLKEHTAGSGAYVVETFKPGEQVILKRDETWNRGSANKPAFFKRVIIQSVPEPATRANLVERGDADLVVDLQASDVQSLEAKGKLKVVSTPQYNAITYVSMNNQMPPFDNVNVRRAIAYALPYDDMFKGRPVRPRRAAVRRDLAGRQAAERHLSVPAAREGRPRQGQGIPQGRRAPRGFLDYLQLQRRPVLDRGADGRAGEGVTRQDRDQGRHPEAAGRTDVHADQREEASLLHRGHRSVVAVD